MIIFWKLVLDADRHLFSRTEPDPNSTTTSPYTPVAMDYGVNYLLGVAMILCFITSTTLNPVVVYFKASVPERRLTHKLFVGLAGVDFITCLFTPLVYVYYTLHHDLLPCSSPVLRVSRPITCTFGCSSQILTFLLALTRFIKIRFPFIHIREGHVMAYGTVYMSFMAVNNLQVPLIQFLPEISYKRYFYVFVQYCFFVNSTHCCLGIALSITTFLILVRRMRRPISVAAEISVHADQDRLTAVTLDSCLTILFMNLPYFFGVCLIVFVNLNPGQISFHDLLFGFMPILTSTCNPMIIILRNRRYTRRIARFLKLRKNEGTSVDRCEVVMNRAIAMTTDTLTTGSSKAFP